MQQPSIRFELGGGYWVPERKNVGFTGTTERGEVEFRIIGDALKGMLNPELAGIDSALALKMLTEFEADIHRIARLEFVERGGGEAPILLTAVDVECTRERRFGCSRLPTAQNCCSAFY